MEKCVIILDGGSLGKNKFTETAKRKPYWVWQINNKNVLSVLTRKLNWDEKRDKHYYEWLEKFDALSEEYWNFQYEYCCNMIKKFEDHGKAQILFIHNCKKENKEKLQELYPELVYSILIVEDDRIDLGYSKTIRYKEDGFEETVLNVLDILTKEMGKKNEI